jgi:hypothetical protein
VRKKREWLRRLVNEAILACQFHHDEMELGDEVTYILKLTHLYLKD